MYCRVLESLIRRFSNHITTNKNSKQQPKNETHSQKFYLDEQAITEKSCCPLPRGQVRGWRVSGQLSISPLSIYR